MSAMPQPLCSYFYALSHISKIIHVFSSEKPSSLPFGFGMFTSL